MAAVAKITCNEMSNRVTSEAIQLMAASVSPTNSRYRGSIAERATVRSAAAPPRRCATDRQADHHTPPEKLGVEIATYGA